MGWFTVQRAGYVLTVEHDPKWAMRTLELTKENGNCQLILAPKMSSRYVDAFQLVWPRSGLNVWLVDGYQRIACLQRAKYYAGLGDIVVLDDALDYVEDWCPKTVRRFAMPHPCAGTPMAKETFGNSTLKVHADTKETWIWRVD